MNNEGFRKLLVWQFHWFCKNPLKRAYKFKNLQALNVSGQKEKYIDHAMKYLMVYKAKIDTLF